MFIDMVSKDSAAQMTRPRSEIHLKDFMNSKRRVVFDNEIYAMIIVPRFSSRSFEYHSKFGKSSYPIEKCPYLARKIGMSLGELGKHVIEIHSGSAKIFKGPFPIKVNQDYAFLMGLFYSAGGIGKNALRFSVDAPVMDYLLTLKKGLREKGTLRSGWHKGRLNDDLKRRICYSQVMFDLLKAFGLKTAPSFNLGKKNFGKYVPSRYLVCDIPSWVKRNERFMHYFVEGYANGMKCHAKLNGARDCPDRNYANKRRPHLQIHFGIHFGFSCYDDADQALRFTKEFVRHLESHDGIHGWITRQRRDGRRNQHYVFNFHDISSITHFRNKFHIFRPMLNLKLNLRLAATKDKTLSYILQRTKNLDNYVLGMIYEEPKTMEEICAHCPKRPYNMTVQQVLTPSVEKLRRLKVLKETDGKLIYEPSEFKQLIIESLRNRIEAKDRQIRMMSDKFLFLCRACRQVATQGGACETCGKLREPCTRFQLHRLKFTAGYRQLAGLGTPYNLPEIPNIIVNR